MLETLVIIGAAVLCGPPEGSFNFANMSATRIVTSQGEQVMNEKEVEYGDFDNDGDLDVVIAVAWSDFGTRRNKLYRNDRGVFREVSGVPVIEGFADVDVSRNAFFRDYDGDGWLDIIIINDANTQGDPGRTKIFMNQHPDGVFSHFREEGQTRLGPDTGGAACGGVSVDHDGDGDFDLYVGNYPYPSQDTMYLNDDVVPGYFTDMTATYVPFEVKPAGDYTVDVSAADLNGDGKVDVLLSNRPDIGEPFNRAYYNDLDEAGEGPGDYAYPGSVQDLGTAGQNENAMEPGDYDGDGDQDIYWSNRAGNGGDRILRNDGNDVTGRATFTEIDVLPASVTEFVSRKATVADLDADGRLDIVVFKEDPANSRPTILRNTSVGGSMSFVDWTPFPAFIPGGALKGWHGAVFDTGGDGDLDIFLGAWSGERLLEQVPPVHYAADDLEGGVVAGLLNGDPVAIAGDADQTFVIEGLFAGSFVSVVLNGADDYSVEILDPRGRILASSDRGGAGVEEAIQYGELTIPRTVRVRVTVLACGSSYDLAGGCGVDADDLETLLRAWGPNPDHPADFNGDGVVATADLLALLGHWGSPGYLLELLARSS